MTPLITTDKDVDLLTLIVLTGNHFFCLLSFALPFQLLHTRESALNWWLLIIVWTTQLARHVSQCSPPFSTFLDLLFLGCVPFFFFFILYLFHFDCPFLWDINLDLHLSQFIFHVYVDAELFLLWTFYSLPSFVSGLSRLTRTISYWLILFFCVFCFFLWHFNHTVYFGNIYYMPWILHIKYIKASSGKKKGAIVSPQTLTEKAAVHL